MRLENWPYRLGEYVASIHHTPYVWGSHDCGILAAGCIQAITGVDAMPQMSYSSATGAALECERVCGSPAIDDLVAHLAKQYGWEECKPTYAHRGDLVVIGSGITSRLGIVSLHGTHIMTPGDRGLGYEPFDRFDLNLRTYHL